MDFTSEAWRHVVVWAEKQIKTERERNDDRSRDMGETNYSRGKIAAYKELLALPRHRAALTSDVEPE